MPPEFLGIYYILFWGTYKEYYMLENGWSDESVILVIYHDAYDLKFHFEDQIS
jgi:hypothetical protein